MAIQYKLKNTNTINTAGNRVYLVDDTGEYSTTNPTGYGNEESEDAGVNNPSRDSVAIVVIGVNKTTKGDVITSFEGYNSLSATAFNAIIPRDGWYQFSMLSFPIYDELSLGSYDVGMVLYNPLIGKVIKIGTDEDGNNIGLLITDKELLETSYIVAVVDTFFVAYNSKVKNRINTIINDLLTTNIDRLDKTLIRHKDNYNLVRAILQGSIYEYCRNNKFVAQKDIEFLNSNNYVSV